MLSKTLRAAAIRNAQLEPDRKNEVIARVRKIRTREQAVAYIKEVAAKLEAAGEH